MYPRHPQSPTGTASTEPSLAGIILCADDYALSPGVSRAIVELAAAGRLSATSCMTVSPFWSEHAQWLAPLAERIDVGLHLTLSDQRPVGASPHLAPAGRLPSLPKLAALAYLRRLDPAEIADELARQLDRFETTLGFPPAFLDGHQHVHQLPVIREAVVALWQRRLSNHGTWLRVCAEPLTAIARRGVARVEAAAISLMGQKLRRLAAAAGIPANRRFAGVHDFTLKQPYRLLFQRFIAQAPAGTLVMCHPGYADAELAAVDPVTGPREDERTYLASAALAADLEAEGLSLCRFDGTPVSPSAAPERSSASD